MRYSTPRLAQRKHIVSANGPWSFLLIIQCKKVERLAEVKWTLIITLLIGFVVVYHHAIYPLLLKLMAAKRQEPDHESELSETEYPSIHLILPAYNEAKVIAEKIRNVADIDYPDGKMRVTLIGDGCEDNTIEIAREVAKEPACRHAEIEIVEHCENSGKVTVLNQAIGESEADIIALSDISALIPKDGFRIAARRFQNPNVGVVNSRYTFSRYSSDGERVYWEYQSAIKKMEEQSGSVIGAHGALYFIRRHLYVPLPLDTINDDFVIPMQIVAQGHKAVHEESIATLELECAEKDMNNRRRKRIAAGNLQQTIRLRRLLAPRYKGVAFNFFSGKVLRVFMPILLPIFYVLSFVLASQWLFFALLFLAQTVFYGVAVYAHFQHRYGRNAHGSNKLTDVIYYFSSGHWYSLLGIVEYFVLRRKFRV